MRRGTLESDHSQSVRMRQIQKKLGSRADGWVGPETLSRLEKLLEVTPSASSYSLTLSRVGIDTIFAFEVSSPKYYQQHLRRPTWPGEQSGVTIGIGYDLGVTPRKTIEDDWSALLDSVTLKRLMDVYGVTGTAARALAKNLRDIEIPYALAERVFYRSTLPRFAARTKATYPGTEKLPPDAAAMLVSLIYNRGTSLVGERRREMKAIQALVPLGKQALPKIAAELRNMKRLWPDTPGLPKRREREAVMVENADRKYTQAELIRV